jgi:hypothetical protein
VKPVPVIVILEVAGSKVSEVTVRRVEDVW